MREIKFRAWTGFEMVELRADGMRGILEPELFGFKEIMQFTGLLDKNGKEIYEGDIVEYDKDFINKPFHGNVFRFQVGFGQGGFILLDPEQPTERAGGYNAIYLDALALSVIGNVHENPELLTPATAEE